MDAVACADVGLIRGLARDRDEETSVDMERSFWPAGRTRGVREEIRMLGVERERLERCRMRADLLRPVARRAVPRQNLFDRRCASQRVLEDSLLVDSRAATKRPVRGENDFRLRVV